MNTKLFKLLGILIIALSFACQEPQSVDEAAAIDKLLNNWHLAATKADTSFFDYLDSNAIYIGTDASERWTRSEFEVFALPYFRKGKAWEFKTIERKVYLTDIDDIAWFDETLDTWMGVCRSSGVVRKMKNGEWKIKHYHLSCTVPNDKIKQFIDLIKEEGEMNTTD